MNLTLEVPDELAGTLEGIAATQHLSIQQLALERLRTLVTGTAGLPTGSAVALLRVMGESPHLSSVDVDDLESCHFGWLPSSPVRRHLLNQAPWLSSVGSDDRVVTRAIDRGASNACSLPF